ncbi:acetyltransferase [Paenibacillus macquariensis subsp. defensor]|nr:acetyltransferase [Paenibacillus macquariensis subsp. defensor]
MEYSIRAANEEDINGLCNIRNNKDLFIKYLKQHENKEVYLAVAAEDVDNTILGFGVLKLKGGLLPKLSDLYVKEIYRGKGVGTDLIRYREEIARSLGYSDLIVSVDQIENPKMIKLITKHGYEAISEPYIKTAIFYNDDGTTCEKTYSRIDLKRSLS